ncbi:MAG TPA: iron ABC transporter permease [Planctomycetota bacterium]|nr:iron ABC transporter permease [Planctomycetota bacterium]
MTRAQAILLGAALFAAVAALLSPFLGQSIDFGTGEGRFIFWELRLPRSLLGLGVGAALATAGVILQAILRNPLATEYTLGVASGSAFAVVLAVVLGVDAILKPWLGQPLVGMAGAVLVISLTYRAARVRDRVPSHTLLLAGVALTYLFSALILAVQYRATPADAARILRWLVGSLETAHGWIAPAIVGGAVALGLLALLPLGRAFNAMGGGEEAAAGVGVDVQRVVRRGYLAASLIVGVVVAFAGPIGFLGLIVPHTLRLLGLVDNRYLIPAAALAGGGFLALCDGLANLLPGQQLPVGIVTQLVGGPFFLGLLLREKRRF